VSKRDDDYVDSDKGFFGHFGSLIGGLHLVVVGFMSGNWYLIGIGALCLLLSFWSNDSSYLDG
jgi:hypothetical protein